MPSFKHYLRLTEARLLNEAAITNPQQIDAIIPSYVKGVKSEEAKAWMAKKLRPFFFNDPEGMRNVTELVKTRPDLYPNMPDYIGKSIEHGQDVFQFEGPTQTQSDMLANITHWFTSLEQILTSKVDPANQVAVQNLTLARKEMSKLMKLDVRAANEAANRWFAFMSSRQVGKKVEGTDVVMEWPDGFYVVRYTSKPVMVADGHALQNCLREGTYWESVKSGKMTVYGIRKPNDEAVVGIRVINDAPGGKPKLAECKGKNNKPMQPGYLKYAIEFLRQAGIDSDGNKDLKDAGIYVNGDKYGTWEDIADVIYDQNGIKVVAGDNKLAITAHGESFHGTYGTGPGLELVHPNAPKSASDLATKTIRNIEFPDAWGRDDILRVISHIPLPPSQEFQAQLQKYSIFWHNGQYGSLSMVADKVGKTSNFTLYSKMQTDVIRLVYGVDARENIRLQIALRSDRRRGDLVSHVSMGARLIDDYHGMIEALNVLDLPPTDDCEVGILQSDKIYYNGKRYGALKDVGTLDAGSGDSAIYRLGARKFWIAEAENNRMYVRGGTLYGAERLTSTAYAPAIRQLTSKHKFKFVEGPHKFGIYNASFGKEGIAVADIDTLFDHLEPIMASQSLPWSIDADLMGFFADAKMSQEQVGRLTAVLRNHEHHSKPIRVLRTREQKALDLPVPTYRLAFPEAPARIFDACRIAVPKLIVKDLSDANAFAINLVKQTEGLYEKLTPGTMIAFEACRISPAELQAIMDQQTAAMKAKAQERVDNRDKYNPDLSSRFAALNYQRDKRR